MVIVTPALADANNGNWRTAQRWARLLGPAYSVRLTKLWKPDGDARSADDALMIALHARRSAASIAAWRAARPRAPLLLALTGTDLYRDIDEDADAQRSLELADAFVVLNELGPARLPARWRTRCHVVLQSCSARRPRPDKPRNTLRAVMVGHLRDEKDPATWFAAIRRLAGRGDLRFDHIGQGLDENLAQQARALMAEHPHYRWLGALGHGQARRRIQQAHVLVHPSVMEGGAQVVIEAIRSGTPVLGSRMDGNVGLLGADYGGYFPVGDAKALATLIERARDDAAMLPALARQIEARAALFSPQAESAALQRIVQRLLRQRPSG
ncbi:MAG: TIGR04348 family glycosyltransferase [Rubrivivax sp.]|nr:TIGR04348 family glycosyltransferase [Rubrivivax sp.]